MRSRHLHNRSSGRRTVADRASTTAALLHHTASGAFHATGGTICSSGLLSGLLLFILIHDLMEALALFTGCILRVKNSDQSFLFLYRFCFLLSLCRTVSSRGFGFLRLRCLFYLIVYNLSFIFIIIQCIAYLFISMNPDLSVFISVRSPTPEGFGFPVPGSRL